MRVENFIELRDFVGVALAVKKGLFISPCDIQNPSTGKPCLFKGTKDGIFCTEKADGLIFGGAFVQCPLQKGELMIHPEKVV